MLRLPELESCRANDPALTALATLSVDEVLTVLRVRSLWFRRNELRRLIGRDSREHCAQLVGTPHAAGLLRHIQAAPDGPQIEPLRRAGLPALDVLTATRAAWEGWHTISPPMRKDYQRFVELSNKGAKELGFADTGAMWRSRG